MSDYLDPNNEELLKDFFAEAELQVDILEQNILVLENDPGNRDAIDEIFRAAHTLKGASATVQMTELAEFTHLVEDVLDGIRGNSIQVTGGLVDTLLASIDIIKAMLEARATGGVYDQDISGVSGQLATLLGGPAPASESAAPPQPEPQRPADAGASAQAAGGSSVSEYELLEMREAVGSDASIYRVTVRFNEANPMNTVGGIQAFAALKEIGQVLKTHPDFEELYEDAFHSQVEYYVATDRGEDEIRKRVDLADVTLDAEVFLLSGTGGTASTTSAAASNAAGGAADSATPQQTAAEPDEKAQQAPVAAGAEAPAAPGPGPKPADRAKETDGRRQGASGSILRVDSKRIDELLNLVSDAVITKATFNQISSQFTEDLGNLQATETTYREKLKELFDSLPEYLERIQAGKSVKDVRREIYERFGDLFNIFDGFQGGVKGTISRFRSTSQNLARITSDLQEGVMRIRMVPISQIFSRFPRLVRDLSKTLGKPVELVIEGEDTELDKSVIEDLLDPLIHCVRNSIDHGIETPSERRGAGKPETGTVRLSASNEGNMINIEIQDDGKGIDVDTIRQKAAARGLIHPSKTLSDVEAYNLIFEPGFSTAKNITNISGRGVGLDVVKKQIDKLNGSVTVTSTKGTGTRLTIKLPLTLAIIQGLLVRVGEEIYAIPITSVIESHRIRPTEIKRIDNYEVFNVREDVISLLRLNRLFKIGADSDREHYFVVVVGSGDRKMGLMVDSLIGEEDVVIKPLKDQYTNAPGIAGATILGDGTVSLIIDVGQLLDLGLKSEREARRRREATID